MWLSKKSLQRPKFQPKSPWNHAVLKIHQLLHQTDMHCYGPVWFYSINEGNAASFQSIPSCVDSFSSSQPQLFACVLLKILLFSSALFYCKSLSLWYNSTFHHLIYYHIFICLNKFKFCSLCLCYIKSNTTVIYSYSLPRWFVWSAVSGWIVWRMNVSIHLQTFVPTVITTWLEIFSLLLIFIHDSSSVQL